MKIELDFGRIKILQLFLKRFFSTIGWQCSLFAKKRGFEKIDDTKNNGWLFQTLVA
jgi:hypothetical protein